VAGFNGQNTIDTFNERTFARAVGPDERSEPASLDIQIQLPEYLFFAISKVEIGDFNLYQ
jgi:hypothetical protein